MSVDDRLHDAAHAVNELWAEGDTTQYRLTCLQARLAGEELSAQANGPDGLGLLMVSDDDYAAAALSAVLARHGIHVTHVRLDEILQVPVPEGNGYEAVLLDLDLLDEDGSEILSEIRRHTRASVLVATPRSDIRSRSDALSFGIDDYIAKPYDIGELLARIRAVTQPAAISQPTAHGDASEGSETTLHLGSMLIELSTRQVSVDGSNVHLTRKEFDLLALLAQSPGVALRREQIISEVWRTSWEGTGRPLETLVASLRLKLPTPTLIEAVDGVGYRLVVPSG